jgi:histidine decarboxylase
MAISPADGKLLVTPPSIDPLALQNHIVPGGITASSYQVPSSGLTAEEHDGAMEETYRLLHEGCQSMLGFMVSQDFQYPHILHSPLTSVMSNLAGDPFTTTKPYPHSSKWVERNVLDYFASLWNAKWPHNPSDPESYWGYVLTMGSTEGNMHALWSARNYLTVESTHGEASMPPVLFFSQNTNFSLSKLANLVGLKQFHEVGRGMYPHENPLGGEWKEGVPCSGGDAGPGTVDINQLEKLVNFFSSKGHPIVVVFNYGTTLKGGCDDVKTAGERLVKVLKKNNMYERRVRDPENPSRYIACKGYWFHVDGALCASYMPFLEMAYKNGLTSIKPASVFDFRLDFISSIVTSGHKFIGTPWPSGIYLTRNSALCPTKTSISVTGSSDTTVSLSRNGHSAFLLWSYISNNSYNTQVEIVLRCLQLVSYTVSQLKELEQKLMVDLRIIHYSPSLSIIFRKPNSRIILKYSLSVSSLCIDSEEHSVAQIYTMKHVTMDKINEFIADLHAPDAFL